MTMKRMIDLAGSGIALLVLSPILIVVAILVLVVDGPPVLFSQTRAGIRALPFTLRKFRTMNSPRTGGASADSDASRTTGLGRLLRATSLDELPTLWNVFKGDMSLVGPRPLLMEYVERYTPEQARRLEVRPGITGWAQVNGRNAISWEEKFSLDVWYVDNRSFWLDARIMLLTFVKVFQREGISARDHATMPEFLGSDLRRPKDSEEGCGS